jgi:hypothetical protein
MITFSKKQSVRSMLALMLTAVMVISSALTSMAVRAEESAGESLAESAAVSIYPTPQREVSD